MVDITAENFYEQESAFRKQHRDLYVMARPDRPWDRAADRYKDDDERQKGDSAMIAWFEYLVAKRFVRVFNARRSLLKYGHSIMFVCADPAVFEPLFVPPQRCPLPSGFWYEFFASRIPIDQNHSAEMRQRLAEGFRNLANELRMSKARLPPMPAIRPLREWKETPLAEMDATQPFPQISDELRATMESANS